MTFILIKTNTFNSFSELKVSGLIEIVTVLVLFFFFFFLPFSVRN